MIFLKTILQDLRKKQNLDIYITILIAVAVSVLGIIQVANESIISSAVLATLALVSFSLLTNRRENEELQNALSKIDSVEHLADKFFQTNFSTFPLKIRLRTAQKAYFWGFNFATTMPLLKDSIDIALDNGLEARFLFIEPNSNASNMGVFCSRSQDDIGFNNAIASNIERLLKLKNKIRIGSLEVRTLNCLPPYTFIAIDPHLPTGIIFIQLTSFRVLRELVPVFELQRAKDGEWFNYFLSQFETVWNESKEYSDQHPGK